MLWQLYIENIAIIEKTTLEFSQGFNVFTGETGAGKSILIDAIGAVLGERVSKEMVRHGAAKASVSALFCGISPHVLEKAKEMGFVSEDGTLLLSRDITMDGRSSCRICGRPATVSQLKDLGPALLQIHGQHDTQSLFSSDAQLRILDQYAGLEAELMSYGKVYREYVSIKQELQQTTLNEAEKVRTIDLLRYQIDEIDQAGLRLGEEEELNAQRLRIRNSAKITEGISYAYRCLYGDGESTGAVEQLSDAMNSLEAISSFSSELEKVSDQINELYYNLEDQAQLIRDFLENSDYNQGEIEEIEERLDQLYRLKRKYGSTVEEILSFREKAAIQLEELESFDERHIKLQKIVDSLGDKLESAADDLRKKRLEAARRFSHQVIENLQFLDMPDVRLSINLVPCSLGPNGKDQADFLISTNPGEAPKPIAKIASGGELSRIMLAIKNVQADQDDVGALIFDEIDTGVSGRAAQKIGLKLKAISDYKQVICVTHLAQIAALASCHWFLYKQVEGERTYARSKLLDRPGRIEELARIMGGDAVTDLVLLNADEMLHLAGN